MASFSELFEVSETIFSPDTSISGIVDESIDPSSEYYEDLKELESTITDLLARTKSVSGLQRNLVAAFEVFVSACSMSALLQDELESSPEMGAEKKQVLMAKASFVYGTMETSSAWMQCAGDLLVATTKSN